MVQCHVDRMSGILLIGTDGGKRRFYFEQAAAEAGLPVVFLDWKDVRRDSVREIRENRAGNDSRRSYGVCCK